MVGSHGRSGLRGMLAGSVTGHVATNASCPVVVVRSADGRVLDRAAPDALARVVVGVGPTPSCTPAVGFAFQAARQRGIPLSAVHAWTPDTLADVDGASGARTLTEFFGRRSIEKALARWRDEYAGVPVFSELARGDPAPVLVAESRGAALLVVGSRGRGRFRGAVRGSVSQTVLHGAHCPIAIVHHGYGTAAQPPAGVHHGLAS